MKLVLEDTRPSSILTREAFENAIAAIAASGGSTNGVLHLLAIAAEAGVELSIDDFDTISSRTPIVADIKPGGRYVATDLFKAGGVGLVARELVERGRRARGGARGRRPLAPRVRRGRARAARAGRRRLVGRPAQADRRARDPARQPRARRLRREARGPRATPSPRAGARLRLGGGLLRRREGALDRRRATSSSSGTKGPRAARACARCCTSPRRSSAKGSATRSRSSPTAASRARRTD